MFWALKKSGTKPSTGVRNIEFWLSYWRVVTLGARDFSSAVSLEQSAIALTAPIQSLARLKQLVQILDKTADWLLTTTWETLNLRYNWRYNWLTRIDQHVKEYFQLCSSLLLTWLQKLAWAGTLSVLTRSVVVVFCVGFGKFWKSMISNVLEGQVKSYEQTSGVFNFIQRN